MYPKLIDLGPLPIHTYGFLLATAILVALSLMARLAESDGLLTPNGRPRREAIAAQHRATIDALFNETALSDLTYARTA